MWKGLVHLFPSNFFFVQNSMRLNIIRNNIIYDNAQLLIIIHCPYVYKIQTILITFFYHVSDHDGY